MYDNFEISTLNRKRVKRDDDSAIKEHILFYSHSIYFEHFFILTTNSNDFKAILEGLLISSNHSLLKKNK